MERNEGMALEPLVVFLMGVPIIEDYLELALRVRGDHLVHKLQELLSTPPFHVLGVDLTGGHFEGRKQRRRSMPLVVMTVARQRPPVGQLEVALRPLQSL